MKIGVMLRHYGQPGGIGMYTSNLVRALLQVDPDNSYVLMYRNPAYLGCYAQFPNASEVVLQAPNKLLWDNITVPRFAAREKLDIIFNPKLSIPLFSPVKTVWTMYGGAQHVIPSAYLWYDRLYYTIANRLYAHQATAIVTPSTMGANDIIHIMGAKPDKVHVIPGSYNELCKVQRQQMLDLIRERYHLPEHYFMFIGGISPLKNVGNILRAFDEVRRRLPGHKLVIVGFYRWKFTKEMELIDTLDLRKDILFTGYLPDEDVPGVYSLADALVFPSLYEGFGMPVLEAMACGTPVVASKTGSTPEVAGDAALLVDPYQPQEIADAMVRVVEDQELCDLLVARGFARVKNFSWERTARAYVDLFETL